MTVAILIDAWLPFLGGGQKSILEMTKILQKKHKINFVIFHSFSVNLFLRIFWTFYVIPQVIFYHIFIEKFQLIDARAFIAGFPAKIISLILKIPVIYTVNGCGRLDQRNRGLSAEIEKILLTKIKYDQEISDSPHFLRYPNVNKNILVIPNGVDASLFEKVKVNKEKIFTLIYVGRLTKIKGLTYLLKALRLILDRDENIILKIIGRGEEENNLKRFVINNKMVGKVIFKGEIVGKELIKEYKSSHLFVLPSLAEGQPITLLEAWAAGLPVVATKIGSLKYYVNPKNGYLVPPANYKNLAEKIITAKNNPHLVKLGEYGFNSVKKYYSWEKAADSYFRVYNKLKND